MKPQTMEEIKALLINAGYEKELNDIFFIEDLNLEELEPIDFDNYEIEPIEFDELY
jgi:hypothetical protein